ncbi:hypothetical protein [Sphingobacterium chungjuense]|uniref:hypothetical protein n=1 Tax=Sphingobacterium chungjuense TaxID=2675553 RepID=UPI001408E8FB|nr:hypothetical protein [Sphingobacterium chungjuense]
MFEPFTFVSSLIVFIFFIILCYNVSTIKKELVNQTKLQSAILRKLESWNDPKSVQSAAESLPFYLFIYDSKDRKFLLRNINTNGYETLSATAQYATPMTSEKSIVQLEIIRQSGITNTMENVELTLKSVVDNHIDIADYIA